MKTTVLSLFAVTLTVGALALAAPTANAGQVHVAVHLGIPVYAEPVVVYQPAYPVVVYRAPVYYRPHPHYRHHVHHGHHGHRQQHWQGHGGHHAKSAGNWSKEHRR